MDIMIDDIDRAKIRHCHHEDFAGLYGNINILNVEHIRGKSPRQPGYEV